MSEIKFSSGQPGQSNGRGGNGGNATCKGSGSIAIGGAGGAGANGGKGGDGGFAIVSDGEPIFTQSGTYTEPSTAKWWNLIARFKQWRKN